MLPLESSDTGRSRSHYGTIKRILSRLPTYMADAADNPSWFAMFTLGRFTFLRRLHESRQQHPAVTALRRIARARDTLFPNVAVADVIRELHEDGIAPTFMLPAHVASQIRAFAQRTSCFANLDRRIEFHPAMHRDAETRFSRAILTGHYFDRIKDCGAISLLQRDPKLHAIARGYLGSNARLAATRLWWSFPTNPKEEDLHRASQDRFHFDLDDWRALKFFFYLTPVDECAGPHVYIRGSHRKRRWKHQLTFLVGHPTDDVLSAYGVDNLRAIVGDSGYGFAEDPFGFHMGTTPQSGPRLMLEIAFGVSAYSKRRFYGDLVIPKKSWLT